MPIFGKMTQLSYTLFMFLHFELVTENNVGLNTARFTAFMSRFPTARNLIATTQGSD